MLEHDLTTPATFLSASMDSSTIFLTPSSSYPSLYTSDLLYSSADMSHYHSDTSFDQQHHQLHHHHHHHHQQQQQPRVTPRVYVPDFSGAYSPSSHHSGNDSNSPASSFSQGSDLGSPLRPAFDVVTEHTGQYASYSSPIATTQVAATTSTPEWIDHSWVAEKTQVYVGHQHSLSASSMESVGIIQSASPPESTGEELMYSGNDLTKSSPQMHPQTGHMALGSSSPVAAVFPAPVPSSTTGPQVIYGGMRMMGNNTGQDVLAFHQQQQQHTQVLQGGCDPRFLSRNHTPDVTPGAAENSFTGVFSPSTEIAIARDSAEASGEDEKSESDEELKHSLYTPVVPSHPYRASDMMARVHRTSRISAPVPVPNLTKKSRGRRVPTSPTIVRDGVEKAARSYVCDVPECGKCFSRGEHLKRHIRSIHTNDKPHKCPHASCGKEFSRHDNLCQHMRVHRNYSGSKSG